MGAVQDVFTLHTVRDHDYVTVTSGQDPRINQRHQPCLLTLRNSYIVLMLTASPTTGLESSQIAMIFICYVSVWNQKWL